MIQENRSRCGLFTQLLSGFLILAIVYASFHTYKCQMASSYLRQGDFGSVAGVLEQWNCPDVQREYLGKYPNTIPDAYLKLKNQQVTIDHLIKTGWNYSDLIRYGYDTSTIFDMIECTPDTLDRCIEVEPVLPLVRHKIIKVIPLDQVFRFYGSRTAVACMTRCLEFDVTACLNQVYLLDDPNRYARLIEAAIERRYEAVVRHGLEMGGSYQISYRNKDFLKHVSRSMDASVHKDKLLAAIDEHDKAHSVKPALLVAALFMQLYHDSQMARIRSYHDDDDDDWW